MENIPVVILCGGQGTRMDNTLTKKELIEIDDKPLLWHVMRIFSTYGHNEFVFALGHLGEQIRGYFSEEGLHKCRYPGQGEHPTWEITFVDTGPAEVEKASRVARVTDHLFQDRFFVAYGEAVANVNLDNLVAFHEHHGKLATITGVHVNFHLGIIEADATSRVSGFVEKPLLPYWVNGGFMLFERQALDFFAPGCIRNDLYLEHEVLPALAAERELMLYQHDGYWQSMKTLKDAQLLRNAWQESQPWKVWAG